MRMATASVTVFAATPPSNARARAGGCVFIGDFGAQLKAGAGTGPERGPAPCFGGRQLAWMASHADEPREGHRR